MKRRAKVELFEEICREYEFGIGPVRGVARKLGVHRRQVASSPGRCTTAGTEAARAVPS
jgi:hypothetical protein